MAQNKIAVVGGGAAGLFAAGHAASMGCEVTLFEKNDRLGKKLRITGKGRCNVTNNCDVPELLQNIPTNARFLHSAVRAYPPSAVMSFFEEQGVPLKTERGNRVFPVSDHASDIVEALKRFCKAGGVDFRFEKVLSLKVNDGVCRGVVTKKGEEDFDFVILCTGGLSYPLTGSDGDGLRFCEENGIDIVPCKGSLVPINSTDACCKQMQGLTLRNIRFTVKKDGKAIYDDFGEMMFTHFGLTGPVVLSASAHMREIGNARYSAHIDLKPALDEKALDARLLSDFAKFANKDFCNALDDLLPKKMIPVFLEKSRIDPRKKVNIISKDERKRLLNLFKDFSVSIHSFRPIDEAIITSGGVSVKEIDPRTMACKKIGRLYLAGEMIDVDGYTGGFNLQIAFSTAYAAAKAVSESVHE